MSRRLIDVLLRLSRRERWLLGIVVFALLPVAVILGGLVPLQERRAAAEQAQAEARALQDWVGARVGEKQALARNMTAAPGEPIGSSGLEQGLIAARLRNAISALEATGAGGIELRFDEVDFLRVAHWLTSSHPGWGYQITGLRIEALETPGMVATWLSLTPAEAQ